MDLYLSVCVCVWHHGAPSDCADSTACLFLLKGTKNLKNFNENPRELGIYANNLMVPVSLPPLSLSLLQMQLLMEPATYLSQQISARTHTKPIRHAPAVGPKRAWQWHWKWKWSWNCVWMLSMRSAQLSPVGSNRIGIGVA